jgi:hypothetical protein
MDLRQPLPMVGNAKGHGEQVSRLTAQLELKPNEKLLVLRDYFVRGTAAARALEGLPVESDDYTAGRVKRKYTEDIKKLRTELSDHVIDQHFTDPKSGLRADHFYNQRGRERGENWLDREKFGNRLISNEDGLEGRANNNIDDAFAEKALHQIAKLEGDLQTEDEIARVEYPSDRTFLDKPKLLIAEHRYDIRYEQLQKIRQESRYLEKNYPNYLKNLFKEDSSTTEGVEALRYGQQYRKMLYRVSKKIYEAERVPLEMKDRSLDVFTEDNLKPSKRRLKGPLELADMQDILNGTQEQLDLWLEIGKTSQYRAISKPFIPYWGTGAEGYDPYPSK